MELIRLDVQSSHTIPIIHIGVEILQNLVKEFWSLKAGSLAASLEQRMHLILLNILLQIALTSKSVSKMTISASEQSMEQCQKIAKPQGWMYFKTSLDD